MTDELTPEQEADVSRLLAEARFDGPIPADVAARLDAVLGGLAEPEAVPGTVVDLAAARQRRRNAGRLLLAAAAVVVAGVGIGQLVGTTAGSDDAADTASSAEDAPRGDSAGGDTASSPSDQKGAYESSGGGTGPVSAPSDSIDTDQRLLDELRAPLDLTSSDFSVQVQSSLGSKVTERRRAVRQGLDGVAVYAATSAGAFRCADADYGDGATLPAYYDAEEAVLVLRRPVAGVQRVDLLACGTAARLNSVDLPAP